MNRRRIIYFLIAIIYFFLFYRFLFQPQLKRLHRVREELNAVKVQVLEAQKTVDRLAELEREFENKKKEFIAESKSFVRKENFPLLLSDLANLLRERDLEIVSINFSTPSVSSLPSRSIHLLVKGRYKEIMDFFEEMKKRKELIALEKFSLERVYPSPPILLVKLDYRVMIKEE